MTANLRVRSLDGVRGVAVLCVIAFHTLLISQYPSILPTIWSAFTQSAWFGVDLFFVLSGFLITGNLIDARGQSGYFRNFYARRTLRIFPLYYAVLITVFLILPLAAPLIRLPSVYYSDLVPNQLWLWSYLQNYVQAEGPHQLPGFGHFWSLAVEEQFYWVWPFVVLLCRPRTLLKVCAGVCLLSPILRFCLLNSGMTPWAVRSLTFTRADTLLFGAAVAVMVRDREMSSRLLKAAKVLIAAAVVCVAVILLRDRWLPYEAPEMEIFGYSSIGILFAALIYTLVTAPGRLSRLFSTPVLRWFGKYSYAIYVFQAPLSIGLKALVHRFVHGLPEFPAVLLVCAITTCVSSAAAVVSWNLLESRFLRLKHHFENQPARVPEPSIEALSQTAAV